MKKVLFKVIFLFITFFVVLTNNMLVLADVSSYTVYSIKSDSSKMQIGEVTTDYEVAKKLMNEYDNSINDVAVIYKDDVLVNAYYASVTLNSSVIYMYEDASLKNKYTYIHGYYGKDAAFLDYDTTNNSIKIKISGYTGWIKHSDATINPISSLATNYVIIKGDNVSLYNNHTNGYQIRTLQQNGSYIYTEKVLTDNKYWYHINESGINGWVMEEFVNEEIRPVFNTFYVNFNLENNNKPWNLYHYYEYGNKQVNFLDLGIAPFFLNKNQYYYSFDGNYFYDDFIKMLDDYKSDSYSNSINSDKPYFNYYMYLPNHSLSSYSASDLDSFISINFNGKPDNSYVDENGNFIKELDKNLSQMYNEGISYVDAQNEYGINALLTFAVSKNESGFGRSAIAIAKNNLFGHSAYDSCPFTCATVYNSVKDSIITHSTKYMNDYANPFGSMYYGSHYGDKGSGMGVNYASDPYWGEKMASNAYSTDIAIVRRTYTNKLENFSAVVGQDYLANTIGIKLSNKEVKVKKYPSNDSDNIYVIKNNYYNKLVRNVPLIVVDKVNVDGVNWLKVRTDVGLDSNLNITDKYSFDTSYGYVLEDDIYVYNNQPSINVSDITLDQGSSYDLLKYVSATDLEDGSISNITYNTSLDINKPGNYEVTYTAVDSMNYSVSKSADITVKAVSVPVINATDKKIKQYTNFDLYSGVSATDSVDGDITSSIKITSNNLDINKVGNYTITYSVTNSLNNTVTKTINIEVLSNSLPIINASDIYVTKNSKIKFLENVRATDLEDGNLNVEIIENTTDLTKVGTYKVVYKVVDKDDNIVTKEVKVYVLDEYKKLNGEFYFDTLKYSDNTLNITGSLAMIGLDNTKETNIKYYLILKNNITGYEYNFPLDRYLENHPETVYSDTSKKYIETWFKGNVNLSSVKKGEYTLYVSAVMDNFISKELVSNIFLKPYTKKATDSEGRGYLFRNNNYKREFPLELIIFDTGLISTVESNHSANMFNTLESISINDKYLNIVGNSFNMGADYNSSKDVIRTLILENVETEKRYEFNIGSIVGSELSLKGDDGLSKAKSWYDTKSLVDLSGIDKGKYIIYLRTKIDNVDDFGELQDIFFKAKGEFKIGDKTYILSTNKDSRYRVELTVK